PVSAHDDFASASLRGPCGFSEIITIVRHPGGPTRPERRGRETAERTHEVPRGGSHPALEKGHRYRRQRWREPPPGLLERMETVQGLVEPALQVRLIALDLVQVCVLRKPAGAAAALQGALVALSEGLEGSPGLVRLLP